MILRDVGCTLYAAWIGGLAGMVVMLPAAVVLINVSGPAVISAPFIGGVSGFLAGVLAVADKPGARRGCQDRRSHDKCAAPSRSCPGRSGR